MESTKCMATSSKGEGVFKKIPFFNMRIVKTFATNSVSSYNNTLYLHSTNLLLKDTQKAFYTKKSYNFHLMSRVWPSRNTYHTISKNLKDFESESPDALLTTRKRQSASFENKHHFAGSRWRLAHCFTKKFHFSIEEI